MEEQMNSEALHQHFQEERKQIIQETARSLIAELELFKRSETMGSETQRMARLIKRLRRQYLGGENDE